MSTNPGVTKRPLALISSRPRAETLPTLTMRPAETATSALNGSAPLPSTTKPFLTTRSTSCDMAVGLHAAVFREAKPLQVRGQAHTVLNYSCPHQRLGGLCVGRAIRQNGKNQQ